MQSRLFRPLLRGATKTPYMQTYIEKVIGNHRQTKNATALEKQIKGVLKDSGLSDAEVSKTFQQLASGKTDSRVFGEQMVKQVKDYQSGQEATIKSLNDDLTKVLDGQFKTIEEIGSPSADLAGQIKTDIETARHTFSESAGQMYGKVDAIVGNEPIVPTSRIKERAQSIIDALPSTKSGEKIIAPGAEGVVKYLKTLADLPDNLSFKQAQFLRSEFNRMSLPTDLTPGVDKKMFRELAGSVDGSFDDARVKMKGVSLTNQAVDALNNAG